MTFAEFHEEIQGVERELAPGNETPFYGHFIARMIAIGGDSWEDSDSEIPADEVAWWREAYRLLKEDEELPEDERATSVQEIFDRV